MHFFCKSNFSLFNKIWIYCWRQLKANVKISSRTRAEILKKNNENLPSISEAGLQEPSSKNIISSQFGDFSRISRNILKVNKVKRNDVLIKENVMQLGCQWNYNVAFKLNFKISQYKPSTKNVKLYFCIHWIFKFISLQRTYLINYYH